MAGGVRTVAFAVAALVALAFLLLLHRYLSMCSLGSATNGVLRVSLIQLKWIQ